MAPYDLLLQAEPSLIIAPNRAVAVAMRDRPATGLALVDQRLTGSELMDYHLAHTVRADLCRRLGKKEDTRVSYERALDLMKQEPERRSLEKRLAELDRATGSPP